MKNIGIYYNHILDKPYILLELKKWEKVFREIGFNVVYYDAFKSSMKKEDLIPLKKIRDKKGKIEEITRFIEKEKIDFIILENFLSSFPFVCQEDEVNTILNRWNVKVFMHHHELPDKKLLSKCLKLYNYPYIKHIVLNSIDQELFRKLGSYARIIPYMYDPCEGLTSIKKEMELILFMPHIPHMREDVAVKVRDGLKERLKREVKLVKSISLNDLSSADVMIYPTIGVGWAPYLMEAISKRVLILISEYKVYKRDISHFEFDFVSLGNMRDEDIEKALDRLVSIFLDEKIRREMLNRNIDIAEKCFSLSILKEYIEVIMEEF